MPLLIDHVQRQHQIVRAAWELIADAGVSAVTVRRVADVAGIGVSSVRYIFESRDALLSAVVGELAGEVARDSAARSERYPRPDMAAARIAAALPISTEHQLRWRVEHAVYVETSSNHDFAEGVARCRQTRGGECRGALILLADGLNVPVDELEWEVLRTVALIEGLSHQLVLCLIQSEEARVVVDRHVRAVRADWRERGRNSDRGR